MSRPFSPFGEFRCFFEFIKLIGIFPFLIIYDSGGRGGNLRIKQISFHKTGIFFWLNQLSVGLFLSSVIFTSIILLIHLILAQSPDMVIHASWVCTIATIGGVLMSFQLRKIKLCGFLTQWIHVENAIAKGTYLHILCLALSIRFC